MTKTIGLTYDLREDWEAATGGPVDANAEFDKPATIDRMEEALRSGGYAVRRIGNVHKLLECVQELDVDLVFNICEGAYGRNRESQVPVILEMYGIPFIGSDALTLGLTLDKAQAKKNFMADGIPTPRAFVARKPDDLKGLPDLRYPLFVKPSCEGTSKGLTEASCVDDAKALRQQVEKICRQYAQPALIEEFIVGREFTVPVVGNEPPEAMPVLQVAIDGELDLGRKFFTFECVDKSVDRVQYECPAKISAELTARLQELAVAVYRSVGCRDFGRVDFRVDAQDRPYVLEINPLPSLAANDAFSIFPSVIGSSYNDVILRIVHCALSRYGLAAPEAPAAPQMVRV